MIPALLSTLATAGVPTSSTACALELTAESIELFSSERRLEARDATLTCQPQPPHVTLGQPALRLEAAQLEATAGRFVLREGRFTTCAVRPGRSPDWELWLGRAVVEPDRGVQAQNVVLRVRGVPLLALPAASLPLGRRRSGLLLPELDGSAIFGVRASQPIYWAIDRSWDATLDVGLASRRGPEAALEVRGAPASNVALRVQPSLQIDYGAPRERGFAWARSEPLVRWALDGQAAAGSEGSALRMNADLAMVGDPAWVAERGASFQARAAEYTRSRVSLASDLGTAGQTAVSLHVLQDLRPSTYAAVADDLRTVSTFSPGLPGPGETRYRLLEARYDLLPRPLTPHGAVDLATRLHAFATPRGEGFVRLDLRPELRWPLAGPGPVRFEPWLAARVTGWAGEAPNAIEGARVAPLAGAELAAELDRPLGAYLLRFEPALESVLIPGVAESLPDARLLVGDEIDLLGPVAQVALRLTSDIYDLERGLRAGGASFYVGHDFGVAGRKGRGTLEAVGRVDYRWTAPSRRLAVESELIGLWSFATSSLRELSVTSGLRHRAGHGLSATYRRLAERPPASSFVAPEELVPSATLDADRFMPWTARPSPLDVDAVFARPVAAADVLVLSAALRPVPPLVLEGELALAFEPEAARTAVYGLGTSAVQSAAARLRWTAPCGCWSAGLDAGAARDRPGFDVGLRVELRGVGSEIWPERGPRRGPMGASLTGAP